MQRRQHPKPALYQVGSKILRNHILIAPRIHQRPRNLQAPEVRALFVQEEVKIFFLRPEVSPFASALPDNELNREWRPGWGEG